MCPSGARSKRCEQTRSRSWAAQRDAAHASVRRRALATPTIICARRGQQPEPHEGRHAPRTCYKRRACRPWQGIKDQLREGDWRQPRPACHSCQARRTHHQPQTATPHTGQKVAWLRRTACATRTQHTSRSKITTPTSKPRRPAPRAPRATPSPTRACAPPRSRPVGTVAAPPPPPQAAAAPPPARPRHPA